MPMLQGVKTFSVISLGKKQNSQSRINYLSIINHQYFIKIDLFIYMIAIQNELLNSVTSNLE